MHHSSKNSGNKNSDRPSCNELLKIKCPWHPHHKHSLWDCFSLCKAMKDVLEPSSEEDKGKAKEDVDDGENGNFQNPSKMANVIFDSSSGLPTKRSQKLTLREIMSIEPTVPTFLK